MQSWRGGGLRGYTGGGGVMRGGGGSGGWMGQRVCESMTERACKLYRVEWGRGGGGVSAGIPGDGEVGIEVEPFRNMPIWRWKMIQADLDGWESDIGVGDKGERYRRRERKRTV